MSHELFREHMALRLYGELDRDESAQLDRHLEQCAECRRFDAELARGLGRARALERTHADGGLPADWSARLAAATRDGGARRARVSPLLAAVTSFAAGILVAVLVTKRAPAPADDLHAPPVAIDEANYARFLGDAEPPPSTGGGQLSRLSSYVRR